MPFSKLLRKENDTVLTNEHHSKIAELRKDLEQACDLSLRLPKANAQYVILTDASFYAAGYVLTIEDYLTDQSGKTHKIFVPVSFSSKIFTPTYLKMTFLGNTITSKGMKPDKRKCQSICQHLKCRKLPSKFAVS